jgi:lactate dehydrogenase-like 2-hydroxyacid dehydrogenase
MLSEGKKKIYITRRVPQPGIDLLADYDVKIWESDEAIPREELIKNIAGVDALFCMLTDIIDKDVLDAAGLFYFLFQIPFTYVFVVKDS